MDHVMARIGLVLLLVLGMGVTEMSSQSVRLKQVMRQKLTTSEKLLEAVVTSNWAELASRGRALERLTTDPAWTVLQFPEYGRHSATFVRATQDLIEAADKHDAEAMPLAYVSLTLSCVRCHQYVARTRLADR
jgi:hypothetical protein